MSQLSFLLSAAYLHIKHLKHVNAFRRVKHLTQALDMPIVDACLDAFTLPRLVLLQRACSEVFFSASKRVCMHTQAKTEGCLEAEKIMMSLKAALKTVQMSPISEVLCRYCRHKLHTHNSLSWSIMSLWPCSNLVFWDLGQNLRFCQQSQIALQQRQNTPHAHAVQFCCTINYVATHIMQSQSPKRGSCSFLSDKLNVIWFGAIATNRSKTVHLGTINFQWYLNAV